MTASRKKEIIDWSAKQNKLKQPKIINKQLELNQCI